MQRVDFPKYQLFLPSSRLSDVIDSFWVHHNPKDEIERMTIAPDSFFKILIYIKDNEVIRYFKTGIWTRPKEIDIPPGTFTFGCRFNILAPEYLFKSEIPHLRDSMNHLPLEYLNVQHFDFHNFELAVTQWEKELLSIRSKKAIKPHKKRLAQALYQAKGALSAQELADQVYLTNRSINRYLNKYLGISLKTYLSIQRAFEGFLEIKQGRFSPTKHFYDQSHYIREVKKYAGESPTGIFEGINDRFIQFRHMHSR